MARPCKFTPIEFTLSLKEDFEHNLDKFFNNEAIANYEKLISLVTALRPVDRYKPYRERSLKVNIIYQPKGSETLKPPKQEEEDLSEPLSSVVDLLP